MAEFHGDVHVRQVTFEDVNWGPLKEGGAEVCVNDVTHAQEFGLRRVDFRQGRERRLESLTASAPEEITGVVGQQARMLDADLPCGRLDRLDQ